MTVVSCHRLVEKYTQAKSSFLNKLFINHNLTWLLRRTYAAMLLLDTWFVVSNLYKKRLPIVL